MQKIVEVKVTYSDKVIKQALSYLMLRLNMFWLFLIASPTISIGATLYGLIYGFGDGTKSVVIASIILSILIYAIYYNIPINRYVDFCSKQKDGVYLFSTDHIKAIVEDAESVIKWSFFKKAYDIPTAFVLVDENKFLLFFPKHLFKNSEDLLIMHQLIGEHIQNFKIIK